MDPSTALRAGATALFTQNARLVPHVLGLIPCDGEVRNDLYQEGMLGLWEAARRYNTNSCATFATYAVHSIRGRMRHYIRDRMPTIHVPIVQYKKGVRRECILECDRDPTQDSGLSTQDFPQDTGLRRLTTKTIWTLPIPLWERRILYLVLIEEQTREYAAVVVGCCGMTAGRIVRRNLPRLRRALEKVRGDADGKSD